MTRCALLLVVLAGCSDHVFLPLELEPGERLAIVTLDAMGSPLDAHLVDRAFEAELHEGESIIRAAIPKDTFTAELAGLELTAEKIDQPVRSAVECSASFPAPPLLAEPGDLCPLPPFVELEQLRVEAGVLVPADVSDLSRRRIDARVRLAWPGQSSCARPLELGDTPGPTLQIAYTGTVSALPHRVGGFEAAGHTASGLVAIAGNRRLAVIALDGSRITRATTRDVTEVVGLPGDRFVFGDVSGDHARATLELTDRNLVTLGTATLEGSEHDYLRLQWFDEEQTLLAVGASMGGTIVLHTCRIEPRLECKRFLDLRGLPQPLEQESTFRTASGTFVLMTNAPDMLSIERLPRYDEIAAVTVSADPRGTIAISGGPSLSWRFERMIIRSAEGLPPRLFIDESSVRGGALGEHALICYQTLDEKPVFVATATIGLDYVRGAGSTPIFRTIYGPYENRCRFEATAPDSTSIRVNFTYGSFLDLDSNMTVTRCFGETCTPEQTPPLPVEFGLIRVFSQWPGWAIAVHISGARVYLRHDASANELRPVFAAQESWFNAIASRGRELWAFHTGAGAIDTAQLAALDPPVHSPRVFAADEVPIEAVLDTARDDFVVIGDTMKLDRPFIRRVALDDRATEVPLPAELGSAWLTSLAEIAPGRIVMTTSDARLLRFEDDRFTWIPIDGWDDTTTSTAEEKPATCFTAVNYFPTDAKPFFRTVRAVGGIAYVAGCEALTLRLWLGAEGSFTERINPTGNIVVTNDIDEAAGVCANEIFLGAKKDVYAARAPYEHAPNPRAFAHGFELSTLASVDRRVVKLLPSPQRLLVLRADDIDSTIGVPGAMSPARWKGRFVAAGETSGGIVLISTDDDQLLFAR